MRALMEAVSGPSENFTNLKKLFSVKSGGKADLQPSEMADDGFVYNIEYTSEVDITINRGLLYRATETSPEEYDVQELRTTGILFGKLKNIMHDEESYEWIFSGELYISEIDKTIEDIELSADGTTFGESVDILLNVLDDYIHGNAQEIINNHYF
jgi:hypothetical protein